MKKVEGFQVLRARVDTISGSVKVGRPVSAGELGVFPGGAPTRLYRGGKGGQVGRSRYRWRLDNGLLRVELGPVKPYFPEVYWTLRAPLLDRVGVLVSWELMHAWVQEELGAVNLS